MDRMTQDAYRQYRQRYPFIPASSVIAWARAPKNALRDSLEWRDDTATYRQDGFTITCTRAYDEYPDLDHYGTYGDTYRAGALDTGTWYRFPAYYRKYFYPATTLEEHRQSLRKNHGKHEAYTLARSYVLQDMRCARGESIETLVLSVEVAIDGITLARAGVGSVDVETEEDPYVYEVISDLVEEALGTARDSLAKLQSVKIGA